jgi:hypothetical protein
MAPVPPPLPWSVRVQAERTLLLCTAALAVFGGAWCLLAALGAGPWPCVWKSCTAWPCAGCGATRAIILLGSGNFADAWTLNPGAVLLVPALLAVSLYAATTLALRLEPWRPSWRHRIPWRVCLVLAVLGNWIYLLVSGRA